MNGLKEARKYSLTELESVPNTPGVYAWYASVQIGYPDWKSEPGADGRDGGIPSFRRLLARHTMRYAPPPLRTSAHGSFRDSWEGRLHPRIFEAFVDAVGTGEVRNSLANVQFPSKAMERTFGTQSQRGRLAALLTTAVSPIFSAPLYIGRADDLRSRVKDHFRDLDKWQQVVKRDPSHRERLRSRLFGGETNEKIPDIFATRAISCGFSPENLEVYVLDIESALDVGSESAKELSHALEWFLNTWCRPILGRG